MKLSKAAIQFIINQEVGNPAAYEKRYQRPIWPGGSSGITIGIGYDLGMVSKDRVKLDWIGHVNNNALSELVQGTGFSGQAAQTYLSKAKMLQQVTIPYATAYTVFIERSLPKYCKAALAIYPGLENLLPDAVGGIVSMIYNRGNSLKDSGNGTESRREMRAMVPHIAAQNYESIASLIEASKRLWENKGLDGLIARREMEAALVRKAMHQYSEDDIIEVII